MREKVRLNRNQLAGRAAIAKRVAELLDECRMANQEHFPLLGLQVRSALKTAQTAVRKTEAALVAFDAGKAVYESRR